MDKVLQLHLACSQRIGVIIVGPSGSGKSTTWRLLQAALSSLGRPPVLHVVNPKAISRHHLLGQHCTLTMQLWQLYHSRGSAQNQTRSETTHIKHLVLMVDNAQVHVHA